MGRANEPVNRQPSDVDDAIKCKSLRRNPNTSPIRIPVNHNNTSRNRSRHDDAASNNASHSSWEAASGRAGVPPAPT